MEGMRILDEVNRHELPAMRSVISVPKPLRGRLSELSAEQLDVFQTAMSQTQLEGVFNNCALDDIDIASALTVLLQRGLIEATPPAEEL
jgi:hypothetical protein